MTTRWIFVTVDGLVMELCSAAETFEEACIDLASDLGVGQEFFNNYFKPMLDQEHCYSTEVREDG